MLNIFFKKPWSIAQFARQSSQRLHGRPLCVFQNPDKDHYGKVYARKRNGQIVRA